ncbi:hypothetical protein, variant 1 [Cryptococcus amylolentus CBS 6039]|uniref:Uncharacterized protein n=1 Tax=Cryptococcus amylolentus CBS 6039 TaxID=1295533 RepID=A0A1E3HHZ9_9TREE|nr:hypothetical protein, variant 1 [Cryptococcus amylolentus CBS 6039]ODN75376.1 hypothetical protein, variant 1 [Cryptococcus amylolentus CBS 6039]
MPTSASHPPLPIPFNPLCGLPNKRDSSYSGSLLSKRKPELVDIAAALGIPTDDVRVSDLVKNIQSQLDTRESTLAQDPIFKGLYFKKRSSHGNGNGIGIGTPERSHSPSMATPHTEIKRSVTGSARKAGASINKALDRVQELVDAANVPLPESPLSLSKVAGAAHSANESISHALVPAGATSDIKTQVAQLVNYVAQLGTKGKNEVNVAIRHAQELLSVPEVLAGAGVGIEFLFLITHVLQFYDYTYIFPPPSGEKGAISSLLQALFFWSPSFTWTLRLPEGGGLLSSYVWGAVAWWACSTILPPFILSTVVSFVPQKGIHRHGSPHTRYSDAHQPRATPDYLVFVLSRLAILLLPLTNAAPTALVDALEMSGNLQGRALGAGFLSALILAHRIRSAA